MDTETEAVETTPGSASETACFPDPASWMPDPDDIPDAPDLSMWVPAGSDPELDVEPPSEGIGALVAGAGLLTALIAGLGVFNVWGGVGLAVAGGAAGVGALAAPVALADYKRRLRNGPRRSQSRNGWATRRPAARRATASTTAGGRLGRLLTGGRRRSTSAARRSASAAGTPRQKSGGKSTGRRLASLLPKRGRSAAVGRKSATGARSVDAAGRPTRAASGRSTVGRSAVGRSTTGARSLPIVGGLRERLRRRREPYRAARQQHRLGQLRKRLKERGDRADARRQRRRDRWTRARSGPGRAALSAMTIRPARWFGRQARRPFVAAWRRARTSRWARILRHVGLSTLLEMALASLARSIGDVLRRIPSWMWAPETEEERAAKAAIRAHRQKQAAPPPKPTPADPAPAVQRPGRAPRLAAPPTLRSAGARIDAPAVPTPRTVKGPAMDGAALHPIWEQIVDTFRDQLGSWEMPGPGEGVPDTDHLLRTMGDAFREMGEVLTAFGGKLDGDTFVEAEVCDYIGDVANSLTAMGDEGDDVYATWREVQEPDIRRHEDPRPAEESANV